ncbi:hypothetical protein [Actinomadura sp. KC345]|uniref:hypothetical protein n=1 Tax=Actinomadura sp. KC345 TaxID=2530371 RepID=UPI0014053504|nr:hypothetical protein [Actinomadura sp. KC345]
MMPPMCVICMRVPQDEDEFSLFEGVRFALDADEEALAREREREGWAAIPHG